MTPYWLSKHAEIFGSYTVRPDYIDLLASTNSYSYERLIRVQLFAPDTLSNKDDITVTITVAMDPYWADTYNIDPIFGISDGEQFVGFFTRGHNVYSSTPPCYRMEGPVYDNGRSSFGGYTDGATRAIGASSYSSEVKMQIKPTEKWGSCHTEHNEGHIAIAHYIRKLNVSKGIYFDMYRESYNDIYRIEYIKVEVY